ncbi:hypothetical protein G570DRAFT_0013, partial [Sphingomonas jaspsi DSM 18422]
MHVMSLRIALMIGVASIASPCLTQGLHAGWCRGVGNKHQSAACAGGLPVVDQVGGERPQVNTNDLPLGGPTNPNWGLVSQPPVVQPPIPNQGPMAIPQPQQPPVLTPVLQPPVVQPPLPNQGPVA